MQNYFTSTLPVYRHPHTVETYIILRGRMFVVFYDNLGVATQRYLLDPTIGNYGVQIPAGQWHGIEVLEPTTIFEVKDGPYTPLAPENILF
ncbi:MAG: WbuC family cupin fold metalloprotein [Muribaculaceae bacterium]|nr:WbuC family cupin fold metalloprotein [Muribaculaceae bacterium]